MLGWRDNSGVPGTVSSCVIGGHLTLVVDEVAFKLVVADDIVASVDFFSESHSRDLVHAHDILAVLLGETGLSVDFLDLVPHFITSLLVLLSKVPFIEPLLVLNLHVDWVVHQAFVLHCDGQLLYFILPMSQGVLFEFLDVVNLLGVVVELAVNGVEVVSLPVPLSSLGPPDGLVSHSLLVVILEVLVADDIVVLEPLVGIVFHFHLHTLVAIRVTYLLHIWLWSLVGVIKVVVFDAVVAHDVVVHQGIPFRSEVPRLLLRIVRSALQAFQLVLEVQHIVSLLIPQRSVLVLGKGIDK